MSMVNNNVVNNNVVNSAKIAVPSAQDKANGLRALMASAKKEIEAALPKHVTPERMMRIALTEARRNPKLLECDKASFLGAVIQASQLGLEPGGALGHCYLIPYGRECQFQLGYRGMLNLAMRSDRVSHVIAHAAFDGDEFEFEFGLNEKLVHRPTALIRSEDKMTHVYAVVFLKNGGKLFDVMTRSEVESIRLASKMGNSGPWKTHYPEMARKTVIRRLFKYTPISIEIEKAVGLDELADAGENQGNDSFIEATSRPVSRSEELAQKLAGDFLDDESEPLEIEQPRNENGKDDKKN